MATPMTADQFLRQLQKWGVAYVEAAGWRTRNRNAAGLWGPVTGVLLHHTGDDAPDSADQRVLTEGRADLPGPLCHWGMRDDGTVVLIGWGRANHAGRGAANVRNALLTEGYGTRPPFPGEDTVDGNQIFYGQETMYSGAQPPTSVAYAATVRVFAAVCDFHNWSGRSCIGHREWTARKPDPGHLDMTQFRADVDALLEAGPEGDDVATLDGDDLTAIRKQVFGAIQDYLERGGPQPGGTSPTRDIGDGAQSTLVRMIEQGAKASLAGKTVATDVRTAVLALTGQVASLDPVDEGELAAQLAPILAAALPTQIVHFTAGDLDSIATAVADEQARRQQE
jgi:hypothetical protein